MSLGDEVPERQWTAELRAMAHPVRLRVLSLLTGGPMTAAEVAREMNLTHANASYHLRQLLAAGTIQVAGEERIRGGVARRYRYDLERDLRLEGRPPTGPEHLRHRAQLIDAVATELRRRIRRVRPTKGRQHLTDAELWVEPEVWADVMARMNAASEDLHRAARPARTEGTILVSATIALFEMEPGDLQ
jgi:DNA-binding transcriptional ArsR family regulator